MLNFDNLIGKKIRHCFVPADKMSVTFVMEDGFRRSLGLQNSGGTRIQFPSYAVPPVDGALLKSVTYEAGKGVWFYVEGPVGSEVGLRMPEGASLVELPE